MSIDIRFPDLSNEHSAFTFRGERFEKVVLDFYVSVYDEFGNINLEHT